MKHDIQSKAWKAYQEAFAAIKQLQEVQTNIGTIEARKQAENVPYVIYDSDTSRFIPDRTALSELLTAKRAEPRKRRA